MYIETEAKQKFQDAEIFDLPLQRLFPSSQPSLKENHSIDKFWCIVPEINMCSSQPKKGQDMSC